MAVFVFLVGLMYQTWTHILRPTFLALVLKLEVLVLVLDPLVVEQDIIGFNIVLPSLQRLNISHRPGSKEFWTLGKIPGLISQQSFGLHRPCVIDVPSLKYLKSCGTASNNFCQIENMPELVRADVDLTLGVSTHKKFLRALTSVRHLTLWWTTPKRLMNLLLTVNYVHGLRSLTYISLAWINQLVGSRRVLFQSVYCTVLRLVSGPDT
ncbi:hypothetical protein YC2023_032085 [Brassica napus]